jgi:hypothetical protein
MQRLMTFSALFGVASTLVIPRARQIRTADKQVHVQGKHNGSALQDADVSARNKEDGKVENKVVIVYKTRYHTEFYLTDTTVDQIAHSGLL